MTTTRACRTSWRCARASRSTSWSETRATAGPRARSPAATRLSRRLAGFPLVSFFCFFLFFFFFFPPPPSLSHFFIYLFFFRFVWSSAYVREIPSMHNRARMLKSAGAVPSKVCLLRKRENANQETLHSHIASFPSQWFSSVAYDRYYPPLLVNLYIQNTFRFFLSFFEALDCINLFVVVCIFCLVFLFSFFFFCPPFFKTLFNCSTFFPFFFSRSLDICKTRSFYPDIKCFDFVFFLRTYKNKTINSKGEQKNSVLFFFYYLSFLQETCLISRFQSIARSAVPQRMLTPELGPVLLERGEWGENTHTHTHTHTHT